MRKYKWDSIHGGRYCGHAHCAYCKTRRGRRRGNRNARRRVRNALRRLTTR